ncbi:UNVERIFIED_CONTAM: hypothetical protein Slati_3122700 [Sesamum latifolium]|uniref:Reverse transcriptase n=1 Tax=Sesamum latifolium TaxID=2727402 RepID=A0AAW2UVM5_9LAMI
MVVNLDKSEIAFSRNVPKCQKEDLAWILVVRVVEKHIKYLGLPALVGRCKRKIFQNLKDKIWKRLHWRCKSLSQAGKAVLLQLVVQAMPTYVMGYFLIPGNVCRELEGLIEDFLWHNKDKYFPRSDVFSVVAGPGSSYTWRSILAAKELIVAGTRWQIGSGHKIHLWTDRWIPRLLTFQIITTPNTLHIEATVADLLDEAGEWKEGLIRTIFRSEDVEVILGIAANTSSPDQLRSHYEKNG